MEISNFKYTLQINQKAIIDNKLDIDIIDASIFDFIHYFQSSPKTKKMVDNGTQYFYLHWSKIVEQIPLLGINSRQGVYKRLQNLINAKLIKAHEENGKGTGLMWFCLGENYDLMFVTNGNENYNLTTKVTQAVNESLQVNQKAVNESLHYNTISKKDNTISNTTSFENFQFSESEKGNISLTDLKKGKEKSPAKKESKPVEVIPHPCDKTKEYGTWIETHGDGELHNLLANFYSENSTKYEGAMYAGFKAYWTALVLIGRDKGKELWRTQKTFSVAGRLAQWATKYKPQQNGNNNNQTRQLDAINTAKEAMAIVRERDRIRNGYSANE